MILRETLDTSIVISLLKRSYNWYSYREQRLIDIYHNSQIWRLAKGFCAGVKTCFRYSFWGRITEIKQTSPGVLDSSRAVRYLIDFYKRWKDKIIRYSKASSTVNVVEDTREQLILSPVKILSIIVVTAVLVNALLSVILQKQMGLGDFFVRVLFLFAGTAGLSCQAGWASVKKSSIFLRKMRVD